MPQKSRRPRVKTTFSVTEEHLQRVRDVQNMRAHFYRPGICRGRLGQVIRKWESDRWSPSDIRDVLFYRSWRWVVETGEED